MTPKQASLVRKDDGLKSLIESCKMAQNDFSESRQYFKDLTVAYRALRKLVINIKER